MGRMMKGKVMDATVLLTSEITEEDFRAAVGPDAPPPPPPPAGDARAAAPQRPAAAPATPPKR